MNLSKQATRRGYFMLKKINRAVHQYDMIREGDRIAVAVSGGKDSLSLLTLLRLRQRRTRERYELVAVHVSGDARGPDCPSHLPLPAWLQEQGYEFVIQPMDLPPGEPLPMPCHRCTWNRRKTLFQVAERLDCNVVALAHHADDLAQTALLNLFYGGRVETMFPSTDYFDGRFRLIRPLAFVPEKNLRRLARACDFPPPPPDCPRSESSRRARMAQILSLFQQDKQHVRANVIRAALRQMGLD
jgi:tRNA 2-thiocytidine biosynthesis protein TtcA